MATYRAVFVNMGGDERTYTLKCVTQSGALREAARIAKAGESIRLEMYQPSNGVWQPLRRHLEVR